MLTTTPQHGYERGPAIEVPGAHRSVRLFIEQVAEQVCVEKGHVVVAIPNAQGQWTEGIVFRRVVGMVDRPTTRPRIGDLQTVQPGEALVAAQESTAHRIEVVRTSGDEFLLRVSGVNEQNRLGLCRELTVIEGDVAQRHGVRSYRAQLQEPLVFETIAILLSEDWVDRLAQARFAIIDICGDSIRLHEEFRSALGGRIGKVVPSLMRSN